ncbi:hypothetical protein ACIQC5_16250 [Paenarthrobacter sp. NPDC092416]|uniref:hypothetical protein n=1 Tax=Paenarthrobacter sp. NPDC092416 TaxID=3364386 RepID=UPI00380BD480
MNGTNEFLVAARQRLDMGDTRTLSRRYQQGELVRVRKGIYLDKKLWLSLKPWQRYRASIRAVALELPAAQFCFETAALIWGLQLVGVPRHIHLANSSRGHAGIRAPTTAAALLPSTGATGLENIRAYGIYRHLYTANTAPFGGLVVTELHRTAVDVMSRVSFSKAVVLADHILSTDRFPGLATSKDELLFAAEYLKSGAKRRRVGDILDFADERSGSAGESLSRAQIHMLGLPAPELQSEFSDASGFVARSDFFWRQKRLIGEFDGDAKYLNDEYLGGRTAREAVVAEKKREDRLRALGFQVVRWDWATASDPAKLLAKLTAAGLAGKH